MREAAYFRCGSRRTFLVGKCKQFVDYCRGHDATPIKSNAFAEYQPLSLSLLPVLHRLEVFVKMRLMGVQGPTEVQALKPDKAAEIGAELIGEFFVYSFAASIVLFEYWRSSQKEQHQDEVQDSKIAKLHVTVGRLDGEVVELKKRLELLESVKSEMSRKQG